MAQGDSVAKRWLKALGLAAIADAALVGFAWVMSTYGGFGDIQNKWVVLAILIVGSVAYATLRVFRPTGRMVTTGTPPAEPSPDASPTKTGTTSKDAARKAPSERAKAEPGARTPNPSTQRHGAAQRARKGH